MAVTHMPGAIYVAPCGYSQGDEKEVREKRKFDRYEGLTPFFLTDTGQIFSFCDLTDKDSPFREMIDRNKVETLDVRELNKTLDGYNKISRLVNSALRQKLGKDGITYDRDHHRYHFLAKDGKERTLAYQSTGGRSITGKKVAWCPIRKKTNTPRKYWFHLAAGINLVKVSNLNWVLVIRPERHLTTDGTTPLKGKTVGKRITSLKARMYNDKYLDEVLLWRYVLCQGSSNITFPFGKQSLILAAELMTVEVEWPGIGASKKEKAKEFANQHFDDDLFSLAERRNAEGVPPRLGHKYSPHQPRSGIR